MQEPTDSGSVPFAIRADRQGKRLFIGLSGELEFSSRAQFDEALRDLERERISEITVDLSGLTFMDSSGLHLLLELCTRCDRDRIAVSYVGASQKAMELFEATGLQEVLPLVGSATSPRHHDPTEREWLQPPHHPGGDVPHVRVSSLFPPHEYKR